MAAQLLSTTVAKAMKLQFPNKKEQADFIQTIADLFKVMNSRQLYDKDPLKCAFTKSEIQMNALRKAKQVICGARSYKWDKKLKNFKTLDHRLPCQLAVIAHANNTPALFDHLKQKYSI